MASKGVRSSQAISMIRSRSLLVSVVNDLLILELNGNDVSGDAEIAEGRQPCLKF